MKDYPHEDISMIDDEMLFMKDFKDEDIVKKYGPFKKVSIPSFCCALFWLQHA